MTAAFFVTSALVVAGACIIFWMSHTGRLAALAGLLLALLAAVAEAPRCPALSAATRSYS